MFRITDHATATSIDTDDIAATLPTLFDPPEDCREEIEAAIRSIVSSNGHDLESCRYLAVSINEL